MTTKTQRPLKDMSAREIREELITDACAGRPTEIRRFLFGIYRICDLTNIHPETLFIGIQNEVRERSGREMPLF